MIGLNNAFGDMLLNPVMATMFIVLLPTFWVMALGWAGVRAGNFRGAYHWRHRQRSRLEVVALALR